MSAAGPFTLSGCDPQPSRCSAKARSRAIHVTRTIVRPHRKGGGTTLTFRLTRPAVLRITIVRVYPSCKRFGALTVRGRAGLNRIRFRGRVRGRALPVGGYRLIVRAVGAEKAAAAVPIVIARGRVSSAARRKVLAASVCSQPVARDDMEAGATSGDDSGSGSGALAAITDRIKGPLGSAAGAVARTARGLSERVRPASDDSLGTSLLLTLVGAFALVSAILGSIVLVRILRMTGARRYY